jgi:hypothetical protein
MADESTESTEKIDTEVTEPEVTEPETTEAEPEFEPEMDVGGPETEEDKEILAAVDKQLDDIAGVKSEEKEDEPITTEKPEEGVEAKPGEDKPESEVPELAKKPDAGEEGKETVDKPDEDTKPSDEFKLPEGSNEKTKERFETLKEKYDGVHTELDTTKADLQDQIQRSEAWADTIKSTGTNPEQFGLMMQYATDINSGTPEGLERAYVTMQGELKVLGQALGKEAPGFDPLDAHPDLKVELDDGGISRERALEIVQARSAANLSTAQANVTTRTEEHATASRERALQGLTDVGNMIRDFDPHYEAKKDQLIAITQNVVQQEKDSSKWPALITAEYKKIPNPAPAPATNIRSVPDSIRPGAASSSSGTVAKKAGSAEEAVEMALAQL